MRDRRAESSRRPLDFLIHSRAILMNHVELGGKPKQTLRVSNEEEAFRIQGELEFAARALLLRIAQINHHIAAENYIVTQRQIFCLQIVKIELNRFLQRGLN